MKTPVRWKHNKTKPLVVRETIARVVRPRPAPEVMVKVKRGGKSVDHVIAHLDYITRNGQLDAETERGEIVQGKSHVRAIVKEWTSDAESIKPGARSTINTILSMPEGTDPEGVRLAVKEFAKQELSNYQYMFVLHTDEPHPHVHLSIRTLGLDGKKLDPRKDDLQVWREVFAEKLREQGIEANATYRPSRGVVQRPLSMAHHKAKHWQAERDADQVAPIKQGRGTDRVGVRALPREVFRALMERDIRNYGDFIGLLNTFGHVERRDAGKLTEHLSVKPKGAERAALLRDFVFTPAFIELDATAKRQALAARLNKTKGLDYGQFLIEPTASRDRASAFARVRDNLGAAEDHLRAARKAARGIEQAGRQFVDRRVVQALETVIRGRGRGQEAAQRDEGGRVSNGNEPERNERVSRLERIARNIGQAGNHLDAIGRTHRSYDRAAERQSHRAFVRAVSAVVQGYGRDPQFESATSQARQGGAVESAYLKEIIAPRREIQVKPRSERDHYTYVARVEDAAKSLGAAPVEWRSGRHRKRDPWAEQERIRAAWREIADSLRATGAREDVALASDVDAFVDRMPPVQTQQQQIALRLLELRREKRRGMPSIDNIGADRRAQADPAKPARGVERNAATPEIDTEQDRGRER